MSQYTEADVRPLSLWRHVQTDSLYVALGVARCSTNGDREGHEWSVVYHSLTHRHLCYREVSEFLDGRRRDEGDKAAPGDARGPDGPCGGTERAAVPAGREGELRMIRFEDGPAGGQVLQLRRAPLYLRVTHDPDGKWDALDQLDDQPAAGETITVYRRVGEAGVVHIDYTERATRRRRGAWFSCADYRVVANQPADAVARDTVRCRERCVRQKEE